MWPWLIGGLAVLWVMSQQRKTPAVAANSKDPMNPALSDDAALQSASDLDEREIRTRGGDSRSWPPAHLMQLRVDRPQLADQIDKIATGLANLFESLYHINVKDL